MGKHPLEMGTGNRMGTQRLRITGFDDANTAEESFGSGLDIHGVAKPSGVWETEGHEKARTDRHGLAWAKG
jgi:hypothetical protein